MPNDVDRTQVVIETKLDDKPAQSQIDDLEQRLDDLQKPREVNLDIKTRALNEINKEYQALSKQMQDLFEKAGRSTNNINGMAPIAERRNDLLNVIMKLRGGNFTPAELENILESVGYKLDGDTISQINSGGDNSTSDLVEAAQDAAANAEELIKQYNSTIQKIRTAIHEGNKDQESMLRGQLTEISAKLDKLGVKTPEKDRMFYNKDRDEQVNKVGQEAAQEQASKGGGGSSILKQLGLGIIGIRSIYSLVTKVVSQNEKMTQAISNLIQSIAGALKPIIDFLATLINTIAMWLGRLFGINKKTAGTVKAINKQLAPFDEINNIGGNSGAGTGVGKQTVDPGTFDWLKSLIDWLMLAVTSAVYAIVDTISAAIAGIIGLITGAVGAVWEAVKGVFKTVVDLIADIIVLVASIFTHFIEGYKKAREEGKSILASILSGLLNSFMGLIGNIVKTAVTLLANIGTTMVNIFKKFIEGFKTGFNATLTWIKDKILTPLGNLITTLYNNTLKPLIDKIGNAFSKVWNGIKSMVNNAIKVINKIPGVNLPMLASGGMVNQGQLFIANENGPELVGTMNGKTTVANNQQIIAGIKQGVMEAMKSSTNNNGTQNIQLYIDGKQVSDVVIRNINQQQRIYGGALI